MSTKKWFMLFLSQLSVLGLISVLLLADRLVSRGSWYQFIAWGCFAMMVVSLGRWMSMLFFDEQQISLRQRGVMIILLPITVLYFSRARTILFSNQGGSTGLLLGRTGGRLFVIIALVFIKGTITTKK